MEATTKPKYNDTFSKCGRVQAMVPYIRILSQSVSRAVSQTVSSELVSYSFNVFVVVKGSSAEMNPI